MLSLLLKDESSYRILNRDSAKYIEKRLNCCIYNLFKSQCITQMQYYQLQSTDATAPQLYSLPKTHKKRYSHAAHCVVHKFSIKQFVQIFM